MPLPALLYMYRWQGRLVFMRMVLNGAAAVVADGGRWPACCVLYDEVFAIPVVASGEPAPVERTSRVPLVADWLVDVLDASGEDSDE